MSSDFAVPEATIASIQAAYRARELSVVELVRAYLGRIEAYDRGGPALNAIVATSEQALARAEQLHRGEPTGALHGIPVVLKDNINTSDLPTAYGSVAMRGYRPPEDATVARRLREAGATVVTVDPAPGMRADVVAPADHLPFADESFDVVVCRIAAHHFPDLAVAVEEMARVSRRLLVVEDVLFDAEYVEEAHRLRDPTHVRCYSEEEWRAVVTEAGFEVEQVEVLDRRLALEPWLDRVEVPDEDRARVRPLLADATDGETVRMPVIVLQARRSQS
jgi:SAM-dependent methyltransferase